MSKRLFFTLFFQSVKVCETRLRLRSTSARIHQFCFRQAPTGQQQHSQFCTFPQVRSHHNFPYPIRVIAKVIYASPHIHLNWKVTLFVDVVVCMQTSFFYPPSSKFWQELIQHSPDRNVNICRRPGTFRTKLGEQSAKAEDNIFCGRGCPKWGPASSTSAWRHACLWRHWPNKSSAVSYWHNIVS